MKHAIVFVSLIAISCGQLESTTDVTAVQLNPMQASILQPPPAGVYSNSRGYPLLPLIQSAHRSIDVEIYQMRHASVKDALLLKARQGVKVRIVAEEKPVADRCDAFSTYNNQTESCEGKDFIEKLRAAGGEMVYFNTQLCGAGAKKCYQHGKAVVVDRKIALISTGNFNGSNLCMDDSSTCNRDLSVVTTDRSVIATLNSVIEKDLKAKPYDVTKSFTQAALNKMTISPVSRDALVSFIRSATQEISFQSQYLKEPELERAITDAAQRGVKVKMTLASLCSFSYPRKSAVEAVKPSFLNYNALGVHLKMFTRLNLINNKKSYMHSKAIVVDNVKAWVGSTNGSETSTLMNREFGIFIEKPTWVAKLNSIMSEDFDSPHNESWEDNTTCKKEMKKT